MFFARGFGEEGFVEVAANVFGALCDHVFSGLYFGDGEGFLGEEFLELFGCLLERGAFIWGEIFFFLCAGVVGVFGADVSDLVTDMDLEEAFFFGIDVDFVGLSEGTDVRGFLVGCGAHAECGDADGGGADGFWGFFFGAFLFGSQVGHGPGDVADFAVDEDLEFVAFLFEDLDLALGGEGVQDASFLFGLAVEFGFVIEYAGRSDGLHGFGCVVSGLGFNFVCAFLIFVQLGAFFFGELLKSGGVALFFGFEFCRFSLIFFFLRLVDHRIVSFLWWLAPFICQSTCQTTLNFAE